MMMMADRKGNIRSKEGEVEGGLEWRTMGAVLLMVMGCLWIFVASVGLLKLPDLLCRSHAMGKAMTLGITLVLLAVGLQLGVAQAGLKIGLAILFQFLTIPVASHLFCLLAYRKNVPRWKQRPVDRLPRVEVKR